jgi:hypothetical protein
LALGLSRRKPLKFPNIGANCQSKFRGEAPALPRDVAFWTAVLHPAGEGPVPGTGFAALSTLLITRISKAIGHDLTMSPGTTSLMCALFWAWIFTWIEMKMSSHSRAER